MKSYREELVIQTKTRRAFINITPQVEKALEVFLERIAPHAPIDQYRHNDTGEDNADAHIKRQLMGREAVVAVTDGSLDFGPWEQIFYGEFDGRRRKRILIKIIGE
jgi:secondary thiamine-phosphate synthase enzyme